MYKCEYSPDNFILTKDTYKLNEDGPWVWIEGVSKVCWNEPSITWAPLEMWPFLFKTVTIVLWMIFESLSSVHPKNIHHFSMKQASTYDPGTIRKKNTSRFKELYE